MDNIKEAVVFGWPLTSRVSRLWMSCTYILYACMVWKGTALPPPKLKADYISLHFSALLILLSFEYQVPKCYIAQISMKFRQEQKKRCVGQNRAIFSALDGYQMR